MTTLWDDLDVTMAIEGIFLNTSLRAAVRLGQDDEANLQYVKNHFWISVGQLVNEIEKLIGEQKEITVVTTTIFKDCEWMSTSLWCNKVISSPTPKPSSSPTLCSVWEKCEMILLQPGRSKLNGIQKTITAMPTEFEWKLFPGKSNERPTV